jgi:hypothetical protein
MSTNLREKKRKLLEENARIGRELDAIQAALDVL